MTFKQIGIAALMMSASSMTLADIRVIDSQAGSWVVLLNKANRLLTHG